MSYCVHCGVELQESETKCPLCKTEVLDPAASKDMPKTRAYPRHVTRINDQVNRRFAVSVASVFMILSGIICVLLNYIYDGELTWSRYVLGGIALAWILVMSPFVFSRHAILKATLLDGVSVLGYLYIIENITPQKDWVIPLALPIVLASALLVILIGFASSGGLLKGMYLPAAILTGGGLLAILIETRADYYIDEYIQLDWSLVVAASALGLAVIFVLIERKKRLKNEIKKRLHM